MMKEFLILTVGLSTMFGIVGLVDPGAAGQLIRAAFTLATGAV